MSIGCPKCGSSKANSDTDYECPECGNKLWRSKKYFDEHLKEYKKQQTGVAEYEKNHLIKNNMKCENCSKNIPEDSKFCVHCGAKLGSVKKAVKEKKIVDTDVPETFNEVRNHLEYVGYGLEDITIDENKVPKFIATHKGRSNLFVSYYAQEDILLFVAGYNIPEVKSDAKKRRLLELINKIHDLILISTVVVSKDYKLVTCSTWCHNNYSKKDFSNLIELFESEIISVLRMEEFEEFLN